MLTRDRPEMAARAVRSFRAQTYANKKLLIWDNGELNDDFGDMNADSWTVHHVPAEAYREISIGALRNEAIEFWNDYQIIVTWDDDDVSHPNRIAEQVALLQSRQLECVGYSSMLFWREQAQQAWLFHNPEPRYCLGTSMCYWRSAWERRPFPDLKSDEGPARTGRGEDTYWLQNPKTGDWMVKSKGVTALGGPTAEILAPRMIASIHRGNAVHYAYIERQSSAWKRVPEWDEYCKERMAP